jgi:transcription termination factor Rho
MSSTTTGERGAPENTEFAAERAMLGSRDREQLHEIASAMGVRGATRLRKADLVEAILAAATSGNGIPEPSSEKPKKRTTRKKDTGNGEAGGSEAAAVEADAPDVPPAPAPEPSATSPRLSFGPEDRSRQEAATEATGGGGEDEPPAPPAAATTGSGTEGATASTAEGSATATATAAPQYREREAHRPPQERRYDGDDRGFQEGRGRRRRRRGRDRGGYEGGEARDQRLDQRPDQRDQRPDQRDQREPREREPREPRTYDQPAAEPIEVEGLLEIRDEGYGFMRTSGYLAGRGDVYVSASQVRRFGLRKGDYLKGATRPAASNEKYPALLRLDAINGVAPEEARTRPRFEELTPLFPDERLRLELPGDPNNLTGRIVDLVSPIGKGQRGLIVSPPKAGKTTIMKQIVHSVERNNPEVHLMVLLVDERPEEVTDMRRHVQNGEVVASTFDRPSEEHTQVAELTIERAKRLVEMGRDVVIILDGITRLARAYNLAAPASGRILSGGVDSGALYPPKKFFGAARNIEEGGSLTILATALIETGSRMDEVIFEEFKGTGNMELRLDRRLAERRIYPAIDVEASSTRHEELLFDRIQLQQVWKLRRVLNALEGGAGLELLMDKIKTTKGNDEFLAEIAKAPTPGG